MCPIILLQYIIDDVSDLHNSQPRANRICSFEELIELVEFHQELKNTQGTFSQEPLKYSQGVKAGCRLIPKSRTQNILVEEDETKEIVVPTSAGEGGATEIMSSLMLGRRYNLTFGKNQGNLRLLRTKKL